MSTKWKKNGFIYGPKGDLTWAKDSALTPTPLLINDEVIRVYVGFRDAKGVSRIGYVDLDANEPSKVLSVSREPVLDLGRPGAFDDNGVILGDVVKFNNKIYMYYVGFQLVEKAKFLAFTGLAICDDEGKEFHRVSETPILDRSDEGLYIRAIHSVILENNVWKIWYAAGNEWANIDGINYPNYHIKYIESPDGIHFPEKNGISCIKHENNEYRIGRPRVYKTQACYEMYYTKGTLNKDYVPGYAISDNGIEWSRDDSMVGITKSNTGWDSITLCYPSLLTVKDKTYMFYNGNDMGRDGFGYAVLEG